MNNTLKITPVGDREILITREFNAPRHLVWDAMSKPELIQRWLHGPPGWTMTTCEDDRRVGGKWCWAWEGPDGVMMKMHGINKEVTPPSRHVRTETFETGCVPQAGEQIATFELTEKDGTTSMTIRVAFPSKEARDGMLASGMEQGMVPNYQRLDEILAEMVKGKK